MVNGVHISLPETVKHVGTFAKVFGGGVYSELIWALAIVIVLQIVLTFTRWGLHTVAVGSNKLGAAEAGVRVRLVMIRNFILCAVAGGLVGILEAVRSSLGPAGHRRGQRNPLLRDRRGGDRRHAAAPAARGRSSAR